MAGARALELFVELHGAGWATATVVDAERSLELAVSYVCAPLDEMIKAASDLLQGVDCVRFSFRAEPGEHRFVITRTSKVEVLIRVLWFEGHRYEAEECGQEVFRCRCTIERFAGRVLACMQRLLHAHGLDGYKEQWHSEFPLELHNHLRGLVVGQRRKEPANER